jgi:multiple sugar transport system ATP-binding protein
VLAEHGLPATVVVVEPTGSETQIVVRHEGHDLICVTRERARLRAGEQVHLSVDNSRGHLFDAASGQRVAGTHSIA